MCSKSFGLVSYLVASLLVSPLPSISSVDYNLKLNKNHKSNYRKGAENKQKQADRGRKEDLEKEANKGWGSQCLPLSSGVSNLSMYSST